MPKETIVSTISYKDTPVDIVLKLKFYVPAAHKKSSVFGHRKG